MPRFHPIPCGTGLLLLPEFSNPIHEERVVKPAQRTQRPVDFTTPRSSSW